MRRISRWWTLGLLLVALGQGGDVRAADAEEGWSYDLWNELMSPYCPGRTLAECPSQSAEELRIWIVEQEAAGRSRSRVEAYLEERFGDVLRQSPRAEGFGLAAYVIPFAGLLGGGAVVLLFLRRQAALSGAPPPAASTVDPEIAKRLDEEFGEPR